MVTGDATTAVVTHAWRVGSRLEECLWFAPRTRCLRESCRGRAKRWHVQPVVKAVANTARRRSSRARSAQLEQLNLNAAGIDVGADAHWVAVPR